MDTLFCQHCNNYVTPKSGKCPHCGYQFTLKDIIPDNEVQEYKDDQMSKMKTIITEDALDKIWDSSNKRVLELRELRNKYPVLVNQIDQLKREYIICLNSISIRDYNRIEETRKIINQMEVEL